MRERFDIVVVGSGAGGGVVAGELASRGRNVLQLEVGPHLTASDFTRWEAKATHDLWWPIRFALIDGGAGGAWRSSPAAASAAARRSTRRSPCAPTTVSSRSGSGERPRQRRRPAVRREDLAPHYERVENDLGVRERADWPKSVADCRARLPCARRASSSRSLVHGRELLRCGSCLQGCPTNAGKSTLNTYIHRRLATGGSS